MNWTHSRMKQLHKLVRKHNKTPYPKMRITFSEGNGESLEGTLIVGDHELCLRVDQTRECECCSKAMCECSLTKSFSPIELLCDPLNVHRVLTAIVVHPTTTVEDDKLRVNAVTAAFPLCWNLSSSSLYEHAMQVLSGAREAQSELLCVLGEGAAERYQHGDQIGNILQFWQEQAHGFGQWLETEDAYSPGERLFFGVHPSHKGDRVAAAAWWRTFCDPDLCHEREFVRAFVETVVGRLDRQAA